MRIMMIGITRVLCLVSLFVLGSSKAANAGLILQGNDQAHIDLGAQFGFVGAVRGTDSTNTTGLAQSASLIRPDWILASKHGFLDSANNNSLYINLSVSFSSNYLNAVTRYTITDVFLNDTKDMALAKLEFPVSGITPIDLFTGTVVNGMEGFTVGYGVRQFRNDPVTTFTGDRRAGFDVVDGVNSFEPENFRTTFDATLSPNRRLLEMGIRPGHSGGAFVLANLGSLTNLLAGINDSYTFSTGFGSASYFTRIDNAWIDTTILNNTAVPEPSSMVLFSLSVGLLVIRRRLHALLQKQQSNQIQ